MPFYVLNVFYYHAPTTLMSSTFSLPFSVSHPSLYAFLFRPICATRSAHLILLYLITLIILGEVDISRTSKLFYLLRPFLTPSLLGPNIFPMYLFYKTAATILPLCERPSFTPILSTLFL